MSERLSVSFEFFPPRDAPATEALTSQVSKLAAFEPAFVSVTYGAGGSTQDASMALAERLANGFRLPTAAHLTCVGKTREEVDQVAREFIARGITRFVALRGDPPAGERRFEPHPDGYTNAADLAAGLSRLGDLDISVAAYPENDRVRARGIDIPIVPGILPVMSLERVAVFAERCGARLTADFARRFEGLEDDPEQRKLVAAAVAAEQVAKLSDAGVSQFHFYTLNRADVTAAICRMLGLTASTAPAAATPAAA